jgi:hypothetical protein
MYSLGIVVDYRGAVSKSTKGYRREIKRKEKERKRKKEGED